MRASRTADFAVSFPGNLGCFATSSLDTIGLDAIENPESKQGAIVLAGPKLRLLPSLVAAVVLYPGCKPEWCGWEEIQSYLL